MLKTAIRTAAVIAFAGVIAVTAGPARGGRYVYFDLDGATLDYTQSSGAAILLDTGDAADFFLEYKAHSVPDIILDTVSFDCSDDDFEFRMNLTLSGTGEVWSATGTWTLKADDGTIADPQVTYISADFTSTSVYIKDGGTYSLYIEGYLVPTSGSTILVGGGDPWVVPGDDDFYPGDPTVGDEDNTANQITVLSSSSYSEGELCVLHFGVGTSSLETLLGQDRLLGSGDVDGTIVPVPGALALGLIGLGLMGWRMRRYA